MSPQAIRAELILFGVQQKDIAARLHVHRSAVANTIAGRIASQRIRDAVARAIRRSVQELWPNAKPPVTEDTTTDKASNG